MANIYIETLTERSYSSIDNDDFVVVSVGGTGYKVDLYNIKTQIDGKLAKASNLSDLTNASTARSNLGLGTVATKTLGYSVGNIQHNGAALGASHIVTTNASKEFTTVAPQTGFNLALGTTAGTVAEGNHNHDSRYYTETEIDAKLAFIIDVSSETISSKPYEVEEVLNGINLNFEPYDSAGIPLSGYYTIKFGWGATEPATLSFTAYVQGAGTKFFAAPSDSTYNLYMQIKFTNGLNNTSTPYSATFMEDDFGDSLIDPKSISDELIKSATFMADVKSEVTGNPVTATKLAAAMRTVLTGTSAPSVTPDFIGQVFIKTDTKKVYIATGTTSSDWEIMN